MDYGQPLARCLSAKEDGLVTVILQPDDLLLTPSSTGGPSDWRVASGG